ncbi:hypothetical protein LCGC14_0870760 [marine sediment metagenome]|uniref:PseI/NeuA/B-like domain-containing protein n=1 Tax=marine sediment metagenome TaxID=412755 RepID=A0A0F9PQC7_9ZZZZ
MEKISTPHKIVAEACCNHMGDIKIAEKMIITAATCGVDYVKFQKRNPEKCVPKHMQNNPHPNPSNAFGNTYLEHRHNLEFNIEQHSHLSQICKNANVGYSCSVWDIESATEIISLQPDYIKIPSAHNNNYELLDYLYTNYKGNLHISLGMATRQEREQLYKYIPDYDRTVLYWSTSGYPVPFNELFLLEISKLPNICEKGYSGHHLGIAVDIAAYTLGARWIERHFTLDRTWKGTDHAASLEPSGLQKLCRNIKATRLALNYKEKLTEDEEKNSRKLRFQHP